MTRLLLVEDDSTLARALAITLRTRSYVVTVARDGGSALRDASSSRPDVIVLDLGLPDMDGVDVIRSLRTWTQTPIIVLSARDGQRDKVAALDAGADDYVAKPFGIEELLARLRAASRRAAPREDEPVVSAGDLVIDLAAARVRRAGLDVRLTPTEWHVLEVLVRRRGTLVARADLLREVWGPAYERQTNYLRVYLAQLRAKLEADPSRPTHLVTESGLGYRFEP
ncbi:two-component system response regulator [Aeromicrobium sp. Root344]|uniref:response regulator n=1 Tax=Aeromicrobium sp. Root344 TaxID=1736521 RepID=UPI0006F89A6A|nr:response regulator [Aeromicrobium sp. Root344]KQV75919.1 two-component system response regulator [Aeromicrobium sp. Root344]